MPNVKLEWERIDEFSKIAEKLVSKYPERFNGIDSKWIVAYGVVNKDKPEKNSKAYDMTGETEPESYTNEKKYFVKMFMDDWDARSEQGRQWIVFSALSRIDAEDPASGKITGLDYKDQGVLVRTLGADWHNRGDLPDLLGSTVKFIDTPKGELE